MPVYDLVSNWAYMAALAWNIKSWFAMMMHLKADRRKYTAMEFRRFVREMILLPCHAGPAHHAADHRLESHHRPAVQRLEHDRTDRLRLTPHGSSGLPIRVPSAHGETCVPVPEMSPKDLVADPEIPARIPLTSLPNALPTGHQADDATPTWTYAPQDLYSLVLGIVRAPAPIWPRLPRKIA